jgi:predicted  nucleic acid-binding Zn-ribbon protein
MAPSELCQYHGFRIALIMLYNDVSINHVRRESRAVTSGENVNEGNMVLEDVTTSRPVTTDKKSVKEKKRSDSEDADDVSRITGDGNIDPDELSNYSDEDDGDRTKDEDDGYVVSENMLSNLQNQLYELEVERDKAYAINVDLQKKAAGILVRLGRESQARGGNDGENGENTNENNTEKESLLGEILKSIAEGRIRLMRQQEEYDELALELQTKLDDKEYKAEEIAESLRDFKR